jgi:uncharacterized membrane protein YoaK (UPF0700 family)
MTLLILIFLPMVVGAICGAVIGLIFYRTGGG